MARSPELVEAMNEQAIAMSLLARQHLIRLQADGASPGDAIQITVESSFIAGIGMYRSACIELGCVPDLDRLMALFAQLLAVPVRVFDTSGTEIPKH